MNKEIILSLSKRFVTSIVVLLLMLSFLFVLLRYSPGDPTQKFVSAKLSPNLVLKVKESFGLDKPVLTQYKNFLVNLSTGDLGISYTYREPVVSVISKYLPFTIIFSLLSFLIQITLGYYLALYSIKRKGSWIDKLIQKISLSVYAIPSFVIGVLLIYVFSWKINLFPSSGLTSFNYQSASFFERLGDYSIHMILPLITLSLGGITVFYKYLRDNLDETFNSHFVMNLRSYGISEKELIKKHVIPNSIGPMISVAGIELGILLSGALITEVIFGLPGMGRLAIAAILSRDYPLIIGCTFISGVLIILSNLLADFIRAKLDKRILTGMIN